MNDRLFCNERRCGWRGMQLEVLFAENPFNADETIAGCPKCKEINSLLVSCDEPGCWNEASCGTPTATGYRHTCGKHAPEPV